MKKKLLTLTFMVTSSVVFLPVPGISATIADPSVTTKTSPPQISVQIGRRNPRSRWWRGRHRGWYQGRRVGYYNRHRYNRYGTMTGRRTVRQTYYVNGRRYTRVVRY